MKILQPPGWAAPRGYSNGIAAKGTFVALGGMIGWNAQCKFEHHDFVGQAGQTLRNIATVLAEADGRPEHIVRMTWYITDKKQYLAAGRELGRIYREVMTGRRQGAFPGHDRGRGQRTHRRRGSGRDRGYRSGPRLKPLELLQLRLLIAPGKPLARRAGRPRNLGVNL